MNSKNSWTGRNVRLVTFAWGKPYIDRLLEQALAAALSPGNLPALAKRFDCTVVVVTEEALFDYVRTHPIGIRLQAICSLRLVAIDDLIAEPWQYGITLAYALFRGFSDLQAAMTDTFILFLNADFILADGSYERLIPYMVGGHRALLSPSYCAVEENVAPLMSANAKKNDGAISFTPRALAKIILDNLHNTIRAKTVNQDKFHFKYSDQFYWQIDENTLLGHQMPIALVAIRPEIVITDINTFWDWGVVYDFCPSKNLTVLGDSDEFLMLELREKSTHIDLLFLGPGSPEVKARAMAGYITQYQIDNAKFPLTLHAGDLPHDVDVARRSLCLAKDNVLKYVSSVPRHSSHAQWIYHQQHLKYWQNTQYRRSKISHLKTQIEQIEKYEGLDRLNDMKKELTYLSDLQKSERDMLSTVTATTLREIIKSHLVSILHRMYAGTFGNIPDVRPISALWPMYRNFSKMLRQLEAKRPNCLLVVSDTTSWLDSTCKRLEHMPARFMIERQMIGEMLNPAASPSQEYDACIIFISHKEVYRFEAILAAAGKILQPNATILLHVVQFDGRQADWASNLAARITLAKSKNVEIHTGGRTQLTSVSMIALSLINSRNLSRLRKKFLSALIILGAIPITIMANILEKRLPEGSTQNSRSLSALISM